MPDVYVMGDVHGYYQRLIALLQEDAQVIDDHHHWIGGDAILCLVGDYFDRGPDGVGVVDLVMNLQQEAPLSGGRVIALLGNHDVWILSAHRFGRKPQNNLHKAFMASWLRYGGQHSDLERLTPAHVDWLCNCPMMTLIDDRLVIHADALLYAHYGASVAEVNAALTDILKSDNDSAYDILLDNFADRLAFTELDWYGLKRENYTGRALRFMQIFGGKQIIHGHTPISRMIDQPPQAVVTPYSYAEGLCVNVDAGIYRGSPGFIYKLPPVE